MDHVDYIAASPLLDSCGFTKSQIEAEFDTWEQTAKLIIKSLRFHPDDLTPVQKNRVFQYYLPIVIWIQKQLQSGPLVLGISAPQGCGKSTLVECLINVFRDLGKRAASVSIDDFYLTREDQKSIALQWSKNPLLQCRGNAITHDLPLGEATLTRLKSLKDNESVLIPRYDKSAFGGLGDRMEQSKWLKVEGPLDLILFEGWMLGFRPCPEEAVKSVDVNLVPINEALRRYESAWDSHVDYWLVIKVQDPSWVGKWRLQAEHAMKKTGKTGMSDEQVEAFVNCYMPAYKAYLPELYSKGPTTGQPGRTLIIEVDENRSPVTQQPSQIV
eukprot:g8227.t1